tara:strand:- start:577 stop:1080 length:504 start_codon:yes stop_codon:yes gene_type:complete
MSRIVIIGESRWQLAWSGCILSLALIFGLVAGLSLSPRLAEAQAFKTLDEPVGMVFNYIEQDSADAFEEVMARLGQVMAESENPERVQQASGWKVYKAIEPGPNNNVLYVWFIDPTVPEADYSVAQILNEEVPNEVQGLYETFNGSFGLGQMPINLELVVDFGEVTP